MKDYPRHNSRKLLWIFQDSQTLTHPDSFAFHSLWHNFTPVVVVGGVVGDGLQVATKLHRRAQTEGLFISISFHIENNRLWGIPPSNFRYAKHINSLYFQFFVASATAVLLHSYRGGCCGETSQDKSEQVRMFVHPFTSIAALAGG